jgi:hypothetical protein
VTARGDALARLPADARERLEVFARALDHVHVDDLALHVARRRQPRHRRAVEQAELVAIESRIVDEVGAARHAILDQVMRVFANAQLRVSSIGLNSAIGLGTVDDRVRIAESLADAVTAIILWERLDADTRAELLGLWDRLLP